MVYKIEEWLQYKWGGEQLCNTMWQGCGDPIQDWISDCIKATQYHGRTIEHAIKNLHLDR